MAKKAEEKMISNGKRIDGRKLKELRPIEMKVGVISRADGSALVKFGTTHAIAAVYGPRNLFPKFMQKADSGILRTRYSMAPFSVDDRKNPGHDRRSTELSKVIRLALQPAIFLEDFPKATIDIFVDVLQADGSTRVAALNAASLALAQAGIPMKDLISACSVGKIDGKLIVDLNGKEDNNSEADLAFAMMPNKRKVTLLQMDGKVSEKELMTLIEMAEENCKEIYELQKKALKEKFKVE